MKKRTRRVTQKDTILNHLRRHRTITPKEAVALYRCANVSSAISILRSEGFKIPMVRQLDEATGMKVPLYRLVEAAVDDGSKPVMPSLLDETQEPSDRHDIDGIDVLPTISEKSVGDGSAELTALTDYISRLQQRVAELEERDAAHRAELRRAMWAKAMAGDTSMLIWLSKQYLGFDDAPATDVAKVG